MDQILYQLIGTSSLFSQGSDIRKGDLSNFQTINSSFELSRTYKTHNKRSYTHWSKQFAPEHVRFSQKLISNFHSPWRWWCTEPWGDTLPKGQQFAPEPDEPSNVCQETQTTSDGRAYYLFTHGGEDWKKNGRLFDISYNFTRYGIWWGGNSAYTYRYSIHDVNDFKKSSYQNQFT